jgi:hypothetical protein
MANITSGFVQLHPSFTMPEIIMQYQQPSGAFKTLAGGTIAPKMAAGDLAVYIKRLNVKSAYVANQNAANQLPSCSVDALQISAPTYLIRNRTIYDHHDIAAASNWGFALPEANRLAMRQGTFNGLRNGLLYGFNPQNTGEGLLNTPGAYTDTLPADTGGHTTVVTYDPAEMAAYLTRQVVQAKIRMNQMGTAARVVILGPQRVLGQWMYSIVSLMNYQRPGAGVSSTAGTTEAVIGWSGDSIEWAYDDTLIGKGAGGTDAILLVIPEIKTPYVGSQPNTNIFATLTPGTDATTLMLTDLAAPREITSPLPDGALSTVSEIRATPGWGIRSQGISILSMPYS